MHSDSFPTSPHGLPSHKSKDDSTSESEKSEDMNISMSSNLSKRKSPCSSSNENINSVNSGSHQFCLKWNNYQTNLTCVFDQLLQSESFVDVTLACDGNQIKAHKIVLSACSPYFQSLFFENPCQHPIVVMRDVKWPELKSVVEFMYKGEINVSQDQIAPLIKIAEMLQIRGLAEVNNDIQESIISGKLGQSIISKVDDSNVSINCLDIEEQITQQQQKANQNKINHHHMKSKPRITPRDWTSLVASDKSLMERKRRRGSYEENSVESLCEVTTESIEKEGQLSHINSPTSSRPPTSNSGENMAFQHINLNHQNEIEIKPGIAEMIREEERAKLLENSNVWLGGATLASSSISAESYQHQLQSMWQKCWNSQNLNQQMRFRERGPLKSWRPETMAEAIFSVLKEGLSLSQAARKYDIPYPTFVLYANRVHNMLGPSMDGGTDLRPKGRGRPQRILLGLWPDEHIKVVIRSVVFRDAKDFKEEHMLFGQQTPFPFQDSPIGYATPNGMSPQHGPDGMSHDAVAAAAVAAVRQQMCNMVDAANFVAGFNLPPNMTIHPTINESNNKTSPKNNHESPQHQNKRLYENVEMLPKFNTSIINLDNGSSLSSSLTHGYNTYNIEKKNKYLKDQDYEGFLEKQRFNDFQQKEFLMKKVSPLFSDNESNYNMMYEHSPNSLTHHDDHSSSGSPKSSSVCNLRNSKSNSIDHSQTSSHDHNLTQIKIESTADHRK
ncbi:unnamed protein product [Diamesa serratosioi]